ncbi:putative aryl-alcohol dehydrogenase [Moniliophthora roreri]|nr:putative aryl-alcohol dehydrogenase [Moniliophthora roreri]
MSRMGEHGRKMLSPGWHQIDVEVEVSRTLGKVAAEFSGHRMQENRMYSLASEVGKSNSCSTTTKCRILHLRLKKSSFWRVRSSFEVGFQTSMIGDGSDLFMGLKMTGSLGYDAENLRGQNGDAIEASFPTIHEHSRLGCASGVTKSFPAHFLEVLEYPCPAQTQYTGLSRCESKPIRQGSRRPRSLCIKSCPTPDFNVHATSILSGTTLAPRGVLAGGRLQTDTEEKVSRNGAKMAGKCPVQDGTRLMWKVEVSRTLGKVAAAEMGTKSFISASEVGKSNSCSTTTKCRMLHLRLNKSSFGRVRSSFEVGFQTSMIGDGSDLFMGLKMMGMFDLSDMVLI